MQDSRSDPKEVGRLYRNAAGELFFQDYQTGTTLVLKDGQIMGQEELTPEDAQRILKYIQESMRYFDEIAKRGLH